MDLFGLREKLANCLIRPPRITYEKIQLGSQRFELDNMKYERVDFNVQSPGKIQLECSLYKERYKLQARPTLVYLHANSSTRLSVKNYLKDLLPLFDVVAFDFMGCGISEGQFITLGYLEKENVRAVIEHVNHFHGKRKFMIWGRSMGAVTAILYAAKYQRVSALVLDSPFADLKKLVKSLADDHLPILPNFLMETIFQDLESYVSSKISEHYQFRFKLSKLKPIKAMGLVTAPVFFVGSREDKLVSNDNLYSLYQNTTTFKELQILKGGHNEIRPEHLKKTIIEFLAAALKMDEFEIPKKKIFKAKLTKQLISKMQQESEEGVRSQPCNLQSDEEKNGEEYEEISEKMEDIKQKSKKKRRIFL